MFHSIILSAVASGTRALSSALALSVLLVAGGCDNTNGGVPDGGDTDVTDPCKPDVLLACACEDGASGIAYCLDDGAWSECECEWDGEFPRFCGLCHGDWSNPAPPSDLSGNTSTSLVTIGAHRSHLEPSTWRRQVRCDDCHLVPSQAESPGHLGESPAEHTWGQVATADSADPAHVSGEVTCSGVYCHGATLAEGGAVPDWTAVGGSEAACGTCHGIPPSVDHPSWSDCSLCHDEVIGAGNVFVAPWLHIDGIVQE